MPGKTAAKSPEKAARVYLITGEVDVRRSEAVRKLVSRLVDPDFETFDLEKFDGDTTTAEAVLAAAVTIPFGSQRKVVIVDRADRLSPDGQERIAAFLPSLGEAGCLILIADPDTSRRKASVGKTQPVELKSDDDEEGEEEEPKKRQKGLQPKLAAAVKREGEVITFAKMKRDDLSGLLRKMISERSMKIEPAAMSLLTQCLQAHPSLAGVELDKLESWAGDRDMITAADVERVVTRSPEDRIFNLIDAVAARRMDAAVQLLQETLAASSKPDGEVTRMLAMLARHFRMLYQVRFLIESGARRFDQAGDESRAMLMKEVNPLSAPEWQKTKLAEQSRYFTLAELQKALRLILECELAVKGQSRTSSSPRLSLELLVLQIARLREARRR